uniref:Lipase domain-containing protein n=1 Tax=Timema cristinae TaxID=61476 RepID=A0A7R9CVY6_TIMCR|nr:unnamed protein product [Timema cristinae]
MPILNLHYSGSQQGCSKAHRTGAYVSKSDCNVIIVDWHSLAQSMLYPESKADTEIVGERTAELLDNLADNGLDLSRVNCVGHSLGGQTVGIVGDRVTKSRVGMLTGLDPAGPMYDHNSTPNKNKLDSEDGTFVLAVHTNAKRLGSREMLGTVDVWVNDGTSQPGCSDIKERATGLCSHQRAIDIWVESIIGVQPFVGWQCDSWSTFEDGECEMNSKITMGDNINQSSQGLFFVPTGSKSPFAELSDDDDEYDDDE